MFIPEVAPGPLAEQEQTYAPFALTRNIIAEAITDDIVTPVNSSGSGLASSNANYVNG